MKTNVEHVYEIAVGVLTWCGSERRSDRYGSVMILDPAVPHTHGSLGGATAKALPLAVPPEIIDAFGTLKAEVIEVRESEHIGDLFRGLRPGGAQVGETLVLGTGRLFKKPKVTSPQVGVNPGDGRDADWLNPTMLYRVHECVVRLTFTPGDTDLLVPPIPDRVTLKEMIAARIFDYEGSEDYERPNEADAYAVAASIVELLDGADLLKPLPEVSE